ncbi:MAG: helix-turn-helix domain-containing protein [Candidatus Thorarchaeota archaeon]
MLHNFLLEIQHHPDHSTSYSQFSLRFPQLEVSLWCNAQNDILELRGEPKTIENAIPILEEDLGDVIRIFYEPEHVQLIFKLCECAKFPLDPIFDKYDSLELPPTKYRAGREIKNLIISREDAGSLLEDLQNAQAVKRVNVLKLAPLRTGDNPYPFYLPLDDLVASLTEKQELALKLAYKAGFYNKARAKSLTQTLSESMNIGRRTYAEHLRKAEQKIMQFLIPAILAGTP